jgi:hypothetical protein
MTSPEDFRLGVSLVDPTADPIIIEFQQELYQEERIAVHAPRGFLQQLGLDGFAEHITDYYLTQHPDEVERVGRAFVLQAVKDATAWGHADALHPGGLL